MPKVRIGQDRLAYYIGIEPPLELDQLRKLPDPYKPYKNAETAGGVESAVVSRPAAAEMVVALFKDSLVMAEVYAGNKAAVENETTAPNRLIKFLESVSVQIDDVVYDHRVYDVEPDGDAIHFLTAREDNTLNL